MYFPDELWRIIKSFQIDYKKHHIIQMSNCLEKINGLYGEIYERWTHFPVWPNTNDIIRAEYLHWRNEWAPRPNLPLVSITFNVKNNGGWWGGYGWERKKDVKWNYQMNYGI